MRGDPQLRDDRTRQWVSAHLFFPGVIYESGCDDVLIQLVRPLIARATTEALLSRWFYIRYNEGGPHVRLRLLADNDDCASLLRELVVDETRIHNANVRIGQFPTSDEHAPSGVVSHLAWVDYEPETRRYGGPSAIEVAEDLFHRSSCTAMEMIARTHGEPAMRLGKGLLVTLVALHTFFPDRATTIRAARKYATDYLARLANMGAVVARFEKEFQESANRQRSALIDHIGAALDCLESGSGIPEDLCSAADALHDARDRLNDLADRQLLVAPSGSPGQSNAIAEVVPSYIHMMNNRLGIRVGEEAHLAFLIAQTLMDTQADDELNQIACTEMVGPATDPS